MTTSFGVPQLQALYECRQASTSEAREPAPSSEAASTSPAQESTRRYAGRTRGPAVADDLDLTEVWARALDSLGDQGMSSQQRAFVSLTRPLALVEDTVLIEGVNVSKKHQRGNPQKNQPGGLLDKEMPLHKSKVAIWNAGSKKADRVGVKTLADGKRVRFYKSNGEVLDA